MFFYAGQQGSYTSLQQGFTNNTIIINPLNTNNPATGIENYVMYFSIPHGAVYIHWFENNTIKSYNNPIYFNVSGTFRRVQISNFVNNTMISTSGLDALNINLATTAHFIFSVLPRTSGTTTAELLANANNGATATVAGTVANFKGYK